MSGPALMAVRGANGAVPLIIAGPPTDQPLCHRGSRTVQFDLMSILVLYTLVVFYPFQQSYP
jgi:hypothetical protein